MVIDCDTSNFAVTGSPQIGPLLNLHCQLLC